MKNLHRPIKTFYLLDEMLSRWIQNKKQDSSEARISWVKPIENGEKYLSKDTVEVINEISERSTDQKNVDHKLWARRINTALTARNSPFLYDTISPNNEVLADLILSIDINKTLRKFVIASLGRISTVHMSLLANHEKHVDILQGEINVVSNKIDNKTVENVISDIEWLKGATTTLEEQKKIGQCLKNAGSNTKKLLDFCYKRYEKDIDGQFLGIFETKDKLNEISTMKFTTVGTDREKWEREKTSLISSLKSHYQGLDKYIDTLLEEKEIDPEVLLEKVNKAQNDIAFIYQEMESTVTQIDVAKCYFENKLDVDLTKFTLGLKKISLK